MGILFVSPQVEYKIIENEWLESIKQIAKRGVFVGGPKVSSFESKYAQYNSTKHSIGVGNGTDALFLALKALGIGKGDEVITAANTFIATVEAIWNSGAKPVLVDCEPDNYLINIEQIKSAVTPNTKAIIPVHLYGQMVDLEELVKWAQERDIHIIEDCAQAVGAKLNDNKAGSQGIMGCFSFFPDKNLGAIGDGGAIITSSGDLFTKIKKLRNHGGDGKYKHELRGLNSRLDPIQASALEIKLKYLDEWTDKRKQMAKMYEHYLSDLDEIILPTQKYDDSHVFHLYVVRVDMEKRDKLYKHLLKKGVLTAINYPNPVHLTDAFSNLGYTEGDFPVCEKYSKEILSLPMNISLSEENVEFVSKEITNMLRDNS